MALDYEPARSAELEAHHTAHGRFFHKNRRENSGTFSFRLNQYGLMAYPTSVLGTRMMLTVQSLQPGPCDVSINLRRGNVRMAEQHLQRA